MDSFELATALLSYCSSGKQGEAIELLAQLDSRAPRLADAQTRGAKPQASAGK